MYTNIFRRNASFLPAINVAKRIIFVLVRLSSDNERALPCLKCDYRTTEISEFLFCFI